ncbi:hypothetical protein SDC9_160998 [bioreactor metagenome]|uniref:Multidrug export protein MepA n=1 Tax=bioreactor metagenome TaxID=1076179 RepID=A0A645FGY8_9ZZZZ
MAKTIKTGTLFALLFMMGGLAVLHLFPLQLLQMFKIPPHMAEIGTKALRRTSLCFPFAGVGIILSAFFQAVGKGKISLIISILRQIALVLPLAYAASLYWGVHAIWFAFPIAEIISMVLYWVLAVHFFKRISRELSGCMHI